MDGEREYPVRRDLGHQLRHYLHLLHPADSLTKNKAKIGNGPDIKLPKLTVNPTVLRIIIFGPLKPDPDSGF